VILPALERGQHVISARYLDSSLAYQGAGYGNDIDRLRTLQAIATYDLRPDLTILIDVPVEIGLGRKRAGEWNRFEDTEGVAFFETVRQAYLDLAAAEPDRFRVVDGSGSVEATDQLIRGLVEPLVGREP
jgi:dTMP kinase